MRHPLVARIIEAYDAEAEAALARGEIFDERGQRIPRREPRLASGGRAMDDLEPRAPLDIVDIVLETTAGRMPACPPWPSAPPAPSATGWNWTNFRSWCWAATTSASPN